MIVDKLENAHLYYNLSPEIAKALKALKSLDQSQLANGRNDIEGDDLYCMYLQYETKTIAEAKFEAHRKYIDIQFIASGREILGYAPLENLKTTKPYDEAGDVDLFNIPELFTPVALWQNMFCLLFCDDAHAPGCQLNGPADVTKIVMKVKVKQ